MLRLQSTSVTKRQDEKVEVWGVPGQLVISSQSATSLVTVDSPLFPALQIGVNQKKPLELKAIDPPVHTVLFKKDSPDTLYIVQENGHVQVWLFSKAELAWCRKAEFNLSTTSVCSKLLSVVLHDTQSTIYWTSEQTSDTEDSGHHSVTLSSCSLSRGDGEAWTMDSCTVLMTECLPSQLYVLEDCLLLWPSSPCPPGVFLLWIPRLSCVQVHVHPRGCLLSHKLYGTPLSFKEMVLQVASAWAGVPSISSWTRIWQPSNQKLLLIDCDGTMRSLDSQGQMEEICHLSDISVPELNEAQYCFVFYFTLVVAYGTRARVYDVECGELIEEMSLPDGETVLGYWSTVTTLQMAGLITETHVYQLLLSPGNQWIDHVAGAPAILNKLNKSKYASQVSLERAYHGNKTVETVKNRNMKPEVEISLNQLQTPALWLVLLQEGRSVGGSASLNLTELEQLLEDHQAGLEGSTAVPTKLQQTLEAVMKQWQTWENIKSSQQEESAHLATQVVPLLESSYLSLQSRTAQLDILASCQPENVLREMWQHLIECEDKLLNMRWKAILAQDQGSQAGRVYPSNSIPSYPLFECFCRLVFKQQPQKLMVVVKAAQKALEAVSPGTAFIVTNTSQLLCRSILQYLPRPQQSLDVEAASVATARLLRESGVNDCDMSALRVLLSCQVWDDAITLVRDSQEHLRSQLFNTLLHTAVRENSLATFGGSILELAPKELRCPKILQLLQCHTNQFSGLADARPAIFTSGLVGDIDIGSVRPHLIKHL